MVHLHIKDDGKLVVDLVALDRGHANLLRHLLTFVVGLKNVVLFRAHGSNNVDRRLEHYLLERLVFWCEG